MTKKQIYAKYGIEYKKNKILFHDMWIHELLKRGNTKLGKDVYTFSLPAGKTCVINCKKCYGKTGRYLFPNVTASLELNQFVVESDIDFFYRAISAQLEILRSGEVRIHAVGDFKTKNDKQYAEAWERIVKENPSFLFGHIQK